MTSAESFELLLLRAQRALEKGRLATAQKALLAAAELLNQKPQKAPEVRRQIFHALYELAQRHHDRDDAACRLVCSAARSFLPAASPESAAAIAFVLLHSAQYQADQANLAEAESQFKRAMAHAEEWCSAELAEMVRYRFARCLYQKRQFRAASTLLASIVKSKLSAPSALSAEIQQLRASCFVELRKYNDAMSAYEEALRLLKKSGAQNDSLRAQIHCDMARAMRLAEHLSVAQQHLREANELADENDRAAQARVLREEAAIAYCQNRFDLAIRQYEQAVELMQQARQDETIEFADTLVGLAMSYFSAHRTAAVEALLISSLRIMRKTLGRRSFEAAAVLHKLAGLYKQQGRFVEASVLLSAVQAIQGKAHLMDRLLDSSYNFHSALNYQLDGHYVLALNRYKRALRALQDIDENKSFDSIAIHIRMYEIYLAAANESRAESHYATAAHLITNVFGYQQPNLFRSTMTLAGCFELQDLDDTAESFYLFAIATARREDALEQGLEACDQYASMLERIGRTEDSKQLRRRARALVRESLKKPGKAVNTAVPV